jgi:hypothetical protein
MRKTASWSGSLRPTEYKVAARMFVRDKRAPLDRVIPTTTSVLPCSVPSSLAWKRRARGEVNATAKLDGPCARQHLADAGRGEEMGFQVKQRNWVEGKK